MVAIVRKHQPATRCKGQRTPTRCLVEGRSLPGCHAGLLAHRQWRCKAAGAAVEAPPKAPFSAPLTLTSASGGARPLTADALAQLLGADTPPPAAFDLEESLETSLRLGLSASNAADLQRRQDWFGTNSMETAAAATFWQLLLEAFDDTTLRLLLASGVSCLPKHSGL